VNPVYCYLDPYEGGKQAVAEAARNIACSGGEPVAITDCLNFGSPERPDIMWQFAEAIRGISDGCNALGTPVVSGNVSFYNETEGRAIYPTPSVGMVGVLDSEHDAVGLRFRAAGEAIILLGETEDELGGSEFQQSYYPDALVQPPAVELEREKALIDLLLRLRGEQLLRSAHDLSNGGLAIALAESAMGGIGCNVDLSGHADDLDGPALLFSESQARALVTATEENAARLLQLAAEAGVPARRIGTTVVSAFLVERSGIALLRTTTQEMFRIWDSALAKLLSGDRVDEIIAGRGEVADVIPAV
jgi:phosphoribosylformylglycinamidine synthase subunit PurL